MRATEFLTEAATSVLYHYCSTYNALKILKDGKFLLSNITGNKMEQTHAPEGYPYFLSLTRSKVGDYHRYVGSSACMFVLNGDWLTTRYKVKPIDYWDRMWNHPGSQRTRESEDRVFSRTPEIPINGITAVHVLLKSKMENRSSEVRNILILAKTRGIPAFLYMDENAWRLQDTRKAVQPSASGELLRGQTSPGWTGGMRRDYLGSWLELVYKNRKEDLSDHAEKLRYNLVYYGTRYRNEDSNLAVDLSNARKPDAGSDYEMANKITDYMRRQGYKDTVAFKNALCDKWDKIE